MASITIPDIDEALEARLGFQAAAHGRSMEDEARAILRSALEGLQPEPVNLASAIRSRFAPLGGVELPDLAREPMREPPN
jgi:plasmid stability protein